MDTTLKGYAKRMAILIFGLITCAYGCGMTIAADLGLSPWDVLSDGLSKQLTLLLGREVMIGTLTQIIGATVLIADIILKEKIGFGTICNIALIGHFTNVFIRNDLLPHPHTLAARFVVLIGGCVVLGFGIFFYMKAGLGAGPRDSFMLALTRRNIPVAMARNSMDFCAFVVGWLCGGSVGIGTVVSVFMMGYTLKYVFRLLNFDLKAIKHESFMYTIKNIININKAET